MQNELTINTPELPMLPISFSKPKSNGQYYRSIGSSSTVSLNYSISDDAPFIKSNDSYNHPQSKSLSLIEVSLNTSYPKSKAPQDAFQPFQPLKPLQPLDISFTPIDVDIIEEDDSSTSCISPSMPLPLSASASSFKYCNELNSYLVDNSDCHQVLNTLNDILSHYPDDIDFKIDYAQKRIDGLVFVSNYCVYFMMYIWEETTQTRIEFRRTSGDALASAKFWSQIQGIYSQLKGTNAPKRTDVDYNSVDFISLDCALDLGVESMHSNNKRLGKSELDELTECLIQNDVFIVDELNYIYESMQQNKDICGDILSHHQFMEELVNRALVNQDVRVSRTVLLILQELTKTKGSAGDMIDNGLKLFENINLLLNHKREFIRRYSMRMLYCLANDIDCGWNMNEICRKHMIDNVKRYETECNNDHSIYEMIHKINEKLMMK